MSLLDAFGDDDPAPRSASEDTNQQTKPDAPGSAESNDDDVPDFMKEFTEDDSTTAEPATSTNSSVGGQSPIGERPGTVSTGMLGVVESATEPVAAEPTPPGEPGRVAALARGALDTLRTRASPIGLRVGNHGVRLLEIMDRPFGRIGEPIRRIVGWVAIATCGTSTIAYLISLF